MDFDEFMGKVRNGAVVLVDTAEDALRNAKRSAQKTLDIAALNTKIKRLELNMGRDFVEIGKLVYRTHLDPNAPSDGLDDLLAHLDMLSKEIEETVAERDRRKTE